MYSKFWAAEFISISAIIGGGGGWYIYFEKIRQKLSSCQYYVLVYPEYSIVNSINIDKINYLPFLPTPGDTVSIDECRNLGPIEMMSVCRVIMV